MKSIFAILLANLLLVLAAVHAHGQSVSPLVVECSRKCSGSFTVTNNQAKALSVTVEPYSFTPSPNGPVFRPLDSHAEVKLAAMSARLSPMGAHDFDYTIKCSQYPCLVALATGMMIGKTPEGMAIRLVVPEIIYVCEKSKDCRKQARQTAGLAY